MSGQKCFLCWVLDSSMHLFSYPLQLQDIFLILFVVFALKAKHYWWFVSVLLSVSPGFEGIQEQNVCNKIMAKFIQNYSVIFEPGEEEEEPKIESGNIIMVRVGADTLTLFTLIYCHSVRLQSLQSPSSFTFLWNHSSQNKLGEVAVPEVSHSRCTFQIKHSSAASFVFLWY